MKYHELSNLFPKMSKKDFDIFKEDIRKNGLLERIIVFEDQILDGRHREEACKDLGIEPEYELFSGADPLNYIISMNLTRRHLTSNQKAVFAAKALPQYKKETAKAKGKKFSPGKSAERAAKDFDTNTQYVRQANKLQKEAPDLFKQVESGEKIIPAAIKELKGRSKKVVSEDDTVLSEYKGLVKSIDKEVVEAIKLAKRCPQLKAQFVQILIPVVKKLKKLL